ncbi:hypothetical protein D1164_06240 [Mariniphaga sediminis]|uniref:Uncharacterized protein n=1 Tax=Mariniphaga sediminis TaxID=1628158 RepID=A0A399D1V1_9BACT|nr:hypothetical protein D1164_06240 [Mariniphaga sediminis]
MHIFYVLIIIFLMFAPKNQTLCQSCILPICHKKCYILQPILVCFFLKEGVICCGSSYYAILKVAYFARKYF